MTVLHPVLSEVLGLAGCDQQHPGQHNQWDVTEPGHLRCSLHRDSGRVGPESLELVVRPQRGVKHVHDDVHVIQQRPSSRSHPLHVVWRAARSFDRIQHPFRECANVHVRRPRRDDEEIRSIADPTQIQDHEVTRFVRFERVDGEPQISACAALYRIVAGLAGNCSPTLGRA